MWLGFVQHAVLVLTFGLWIKPTIMDKSLGTLLDFWGIFQFTQVQPLPLPQRWTRAPRIFSEFQLCIGGWGELQENFAKDALLYEGTQKLQNNMNNALRSQRLLSMIVGLISVTIKSPVDVPLLTGDKHKASCRVPAITFQVPHGQPVESIHSTVVISADSVKLNCNLPDSPE